MHICRVSLVISLAWATGMVAYAQQGLRRDPAAVTAISQSIAAFGGVVPTDSVASGTVRIVRGARTENGAIRVLTRSTDQTSEQITIGSSNRAYVYSRSATSERQDSIVRVGSSELAANSQAVDFPMAFLAAAFNDPDVSLQYVGQETLGGTSVHHIRVWKNFSTQANLQFLSVFSTRDVYIDVTSNLPKAVSWKRREGRGAAPRVAVDAVFSDYRVVNGVRYPFLVAKSLNGISWMTITIQSVTFSNGLTDNDFPIQ